ncbi:tigger transposable element-derived protein 1 [Trichonephila clavipes]|nr:tigger transposable element-derived protein 1 [Trichonephila clavipes]
MKINSEVDNDDVQELLDSYNQESAIDEHIGMREQVQDIEKLESLDSVQSEEGMAAGNSTETFSFIEKELKVLENRDSNDERIFSTKKRIKKLLACYEEILREKQSLGWQITKLDFMKSSTSK